MSGVEVLTASDGRALAMIVRHDFDDFAAHPPTFATTAERDWLARHYRVSSPELERNTKAHLTSDEQALQVTVLNRPAGALVKPHWHINERAPVGEVRQQVMVCLTGAARIGVFDRNGPHIGDVELGPGDLILLYEGHSVETLEDDTRLIEIKQGPMPEDPFSDNVAIAENGEGDH